MPNPTDDSVTQPNPTPVEQPITTAELVRRHGERIALASMSRRPTFNVSPISWSTAPPAPLPTPSEEWPDFPDEDDERRDEDEEDMPAHYSNNDWANMLTGSYIKYGNSCLRVIDVSEQGGGNFRLHCEDATYGRPPANVAISFTEDTQASVFIMDRPLAKIVNTQSVGPCMVRPVIRRTRRKGFFSEDYEATILATGVRTSVHRLSGPDRRAVASAMYGTGAPPLTDGRYISSDGAFALLDVGSREGAMVIGVADDNSRAVVSQLAAAFGISTAEVNEELDATTMMALARLLRVVIPSKALYWSDSRIGTIAGTVITIDQNADLLIGLIRAAFPQYQVAVGE